MLDHSTPDLRGRWPVLMGFLMEKGADFWGDKCWQKLVSWPAHVQASHKQILDIPVARVAMAQRQI